MDLFTGAAGTRLGREAYLEDFAAREGELTMAVSWKIEVGQVFAEPGNPSWVAYSQGRWTDAIERLGEQAPSWRARTRAARERAVVLGRVRVVAEPRSPYLEWELHVLALRAREGEHIRVLHADTWEGGDLPECVTLGDAVYRIHYDEHGVLAGATRHLDTALTERIHTLARTLWDRGEDLDVYLRRRPAHWTHTPGERS